MEKLIKKFNYINATTGGIEEFTPVTKWVEASKECAELSKKIAIDFVDYYSKYIGQRMLNKVETLTDNDLFTKFLETYEL